MFSASDIPSPLPVSEGPGANWSIGRVNGQRGYNCPTDTKSFFMFVAALESGATPYLPDNDSTYGAEMRTRNLSAPWGGADLKKSKKVSKISQFLRSNIVK